MNVESLITGVEHVGLPTADVDSTVAFYEGLGFTVVLRVTNPQTGNRCVFLKMKNLMIETYGSKAPAGKPGALDHVAFAVSDIDAVYAKMKEGGYQIIDPEVQHRTYWPNGVKFFTIMGPNGEKIEFSQIL